MLPRYPASKTTGKGGTHPWEIELNIVRCSKRAVLAKLNVEVILSHSDHSWGILVALCNAALYHILKLCERLLLRE